MGVTEFTAQSGTSGTITKSAILGWSVATGANRCGIDTPGAFQTERRNFLSYDTNAGIPQKAIVTKVEFFTHVSGLSTSGNNPFSWKNSYYIGTWIGGTLGGGTGAQWQTEFDGGTFAVQNIGAPSSVYIDLGAQGVSSYNNAGDTDVAVRDTSDWIAGQGNWDWAGTESRQTLRVSWYLPQVI